MGYRQKDAIRLTVAAALVDKEIANPKEYASVCDEIRDKLADQASKLTTREVHIDVNTADDPELGRYYLTVTGLSMEAGDDGSVGRGNRANGLITPCRPMSLEASAGKNPVNHVGKIYNLLGILIAQDIVEEAGGNVQEVHVRTSPRSANRSTAAGRERPAPPRERRQARQGPEAGRSGRAPGSTTSGRSRRSS